MYEARQVPRDENRPPITQSLYSVGSSSSGSSNSNQSLPLVEEVTKRTEVVTRRIQELWLAMQDLAKKDSFVPCSERIRVGVAELIAIFPHSMTDEVLKGALRQLNQNTSAIQAESTNLQRALNSENPANVELYLQQVRNCAYNLAKATKTLVTQFQQWLESWPALVFFPFTKLVFLERSFKVNNRKVKKLPRVKEVQTLRGWKENSDFTRVGGFASIF